MDDEEILKLLGKDKSIELYLNDFHSFMKWYSQIEQEQASRKIMTIAIRCFQIGQEYSKSTKEGCGKTFMPWGEEDISGYKESSWTCGNIWNRKPLLCNDCRSSTKNELGDKK